MTHSSFNPSMVAPERLERVLVARHQLLQDVTDRLWNSTETRNCPAIVLVGPRGMGKSHLVALANHRLKQRDPEGAKVAIAWLEEDPWKVQTYFDLLCTVLRALEGSAGEQSLRHDTRNELHDLERRESEAVRRIRQSVGEERTLVVIVENLTAILENLGTEGQRKWRALLQDSKRWALLATAPAISRKLSAYGEPFYGFFQVEVLNGLAPEDGIAMLRNLAREDADERMANALEHPGTAARVEAVQILAGGNPRVLVVLYDFLRAGTDFRVVDALYKTIDAMTPYYQSLIQDRSPQQRKILVLLCESPKALNVATIAERCSMTHQVASSQLKQLRDDRFVRSRESGRESHYELAEPFLRICWEAKSQTGGPLPVLVELLAYWYRYDELGEIGLTAEGDSRVYWTEAMRLRESGRLEAPASTMAQRLHGDRWIDAGEAASGSEENREKFDAYCTEYEGKAFKHPEYWWGRLRALVPPGEESPEDNAAIVSPLLDSGSREDLVSSLQALTAGLASDSSDAACQARAIASVAAVLEGRGEIRSALRIRQNDELPKRVEIGSLFNVAVTKLRIGDLLFYVGHLEEALTLWREECLPAFSGLPSANTWFRIAVVCARRVEFDEAIRILKQECLPVYATLEDVRSCAPAWCLIAEICQERGEWDEALRILRTECLPVFAKFADDRWLAVSWVFIANVSLLRGDWEEALRIYEAECLPVVEKVGDALWGAVIWAKIAQIYRGCGKWDESLRILQNECSPVFEKRGSVSERAVIDSQLAQVYQNRGECNKALHKLELECLPVFQRLRDTGQIARTRRSIADCRAFQGQVEEAILIYENDVLPVARKLENKHDLMFACRGLAQLLRRRNLPRDSARACALLRESLEIAEALRVPEASGIRELLAQADSASSGSGGACMITSSDVNSYS